MNSLWGFNEYHVFLLCTNWFNKKKEQKKKKTRKKNNIVNKMSDVPSGWNISSFAAEDVIVNRLSWEPLKALLMDEQWMQCQDISSAVDKKKKKKSEIVLLEDSTSNLNTYCLKSILSYRSLFCWWNVNFLFFFFLLLVRHKEGSRKSALPFSNDEFHQRDKNQWPSP